MIYCFGASIPFKTRLALPPALIVPDASSYWYLININQRRSHRFNASEHLLKLMSFLSSLNTLFCFIKQTLKRLGISMFAYYFIDAENLNLN